MFIVIGWTNLQSSLIIEALRCLIPEFSALISFTIRMSPNDAFGTKLLLLIGLEGNFAW